MKFVAGLSRFRSNLVSFSQEEPLSKFSLIVIILLDFFLLSVVFTGLDTHTSQLTSPWDYIPYECRRVLIEDSWSEADRLDRLQGIVLQDYNNYLRADSFFNKDKLEKMHPELRQYFEKIKAIAADKQIHEMFVERQGLGQTLKAWEKRHGISKGVYDTHLLESIASKQGESGSSLEDSMNKISSEYEKISASIEQTSQKINMQAPVIAFWEFVGPFDAGLRERLIDDLKHYKVIYAFRVFCWQLLFLLPIFAVAMFWYVRSSNRNFAIQKMFSAHLLIIASIPILFNLIKLVLDLIPNTFFKAIFDLLERLHIVALWHYLLIVIAILIGILIVYVIQKKFLRRQRVYEKRLLAGKCCLCGKKLPLSLKYNYCPFCGESQTRQCNNCQEETYLGGIKCINCGK